MYIGFLLSCTYVRTYMLIIYRETCEQLETSLATGMEKIGHLMEELFCLTEVSQDSPIWSEFRDQIDAIVLGGLKSAFLAAIGSLLQRVLLYEQVMYYSEKVTKFGLICVMKVTVDC